MAALPNRRLGTVIPDGQLVLKLAPQELAWIVLDDLNWQIVGMSGNRNHFHPGNYIDGLQEVGTPYDGNTLKLVEEAVLEAWGWWRMGCWHRMQGQETTTGTL